MAKKILLADDSITIQKVVELTFSDGDYEIVAVNNGSKAIQKLQEMRPDIILSDIIMPEKNGYEVCEFVKSHPDYKTIPVILLTGTFEPFDPDRAERAGCDAVVTKPFESQSLIHKVEELIQRNAAAAPSAPEPPAPSPFDETHSEKRTELEATPSRSQEDEPFAEPAQPSPEEIFGIGPEPEAPAAAAPLDRSGSVFDETNPPRSAAEPSPLFGEPQTPPEPAAFSGETAGFPKTSFAEPAAPPQPEPERAPEPEAAPEPGWSAATTAFPKMSFDDFQRMSQDASAPPPPQPEEPSSGPEPLEWPRAARPLEGESLFSAAPEPAPAPAGFGFDAPAEEPKVIPFEPAPPPSFAAPEPQPEPEPSYSGATTAFPKMSFDDLQRLREESAPPPAVEELPWTSSPEPLIGGPAGEEPPAAPQTAPAAGDRAASLSDSLSDSLSAEQIDRIARRVVELMADKAVRDIAWEVIPDLAQVIVRERIRELETEA